MPFAWLGPWVATAAAGYLLIAVLDAERGATWQRASMAVGALAAVSGMLAVIEVDRDSSREFILTTTLAVLAVSNTAGVGLWRLKWREGIASLPPILSATAATLLWAWFDMSPAWAGIWVALPAAGYLVAAELDKARRTEWRWTAFGTGIVALSSAHLAIESPQHGAAALPLTYATLLGASAWDTFRRQDWGALIPPALAAGLGAATLWAADTEPEWWAFPSLGVAAAIALSERLWRKGEDSAAAAWGYVIAPSDLSLCSSRPQLLSRRRDMALLLHPRAPF